MFQEGHKIIGPSSDFEEIVDNFGIYNKIFAVYGVASFQVGWERVVFMCI